MPEVVGIEEPIECLKALVRSHTDVTLTNADRFTVMLTEYRHLSGLRREQIADLRERYAFMVEGIVSRGQHSGRIRADVDSRILTRLLLGQVNWTTLWYSPEGKWKPADISDMLFEVGLRGATR